jgi:hypothetical protein
MSTLAYFLAKLLVDIPRIVIGAACYTLAVASFFPYRQSIINLYTIILMIYLTSFSMGYWISTAFSITKAGLIGVGFSLLWALALSGVSPSLYEVRSYSPLTSWLWTISAPRWALEAFWLSELQKRPWVEKDFDEKWNNGFIKNNFFNDLIMMAIIWIAWSILSFLGLKLFKRSKQK